MGSVCLGPLPMDHPFRDIAAGFGSAVFERQCHQANLRPKFFKSELQASQVCKKFCMTLYSQAQCLAMSPFALLLCLPLCSGSSDNPHESGGMHLFDMLVVTVLILLLTSSVLIVKVLGARDSKGSSKVLLRDAGVQCSLSKEAHGVSSSSRACHKSLDPGTPALALTMTTATTTMTMYHAPSSTCWHSTPQCHHIRKSKVKAFLSCSSCTPLQTQG
jgi:hypothetical protein